MREGWEYKKLGEVCEPKNQIERATKCFSPSDLIEYVDISSIDNLSNKIVSSTSYRMEDAPSRAQQKVYLGDIIVSTVRPNLKNVAKVERNVGNFVVSSGFCVLRVKDRVLEDYVYHYVSSDLFAHHLMKLSTGANYPAVRDKDVRDSMIPFPPKPIQLAIVSELDQINDLIRLKKEQLKEYDNLAQSIFYDMFGDPMVNEKGWEVKKLGDVCKIGTGSTPDRKNADYYVGNIPWVKSTEVCNSFIEETQEMISNEALAQTNCNIYPKGSVLIAMYGQGKTRGQVAILKIDACTNQAVAAMIPSEYVCSNFLFYHLRLLYENIRSMARGGNQANLNLTLVKSITILLPPLPLQQEFSSRIEQIEKLKTEVQKTITDLETLLASRMQYWFE